jgi:ferredoxin
MKATDDSLINLPNPENPRRSFLRKVLGVDAFGETVADVFPGLEENNAPLSKTVSMRIDADRCTACGQCSRFCVPDALSLSERDNSFSLRFLAASCIDCGLCAQSCPEGALELEVSIPAEAGPAGGSLEVAAGDLRPCVVCHAPIAVIAGHTHCFVCRKRPETPAYLSAF